MTRHNDIRTTMSGLLISAMLTGAGCSRDIRAQPDEGRLVPIEDAAFVPLDSTRPEGPQIAILWGDPAAGESTMLLKFGTGGGILHYHTADYHLLLLEGQMKHWSHHEHEAEAKVLHPGSYWYQPGGESHADMCLTDECVMFIKWSGPRDVVLSADRRD